MIVSLGLPVGFNSSLYSFGHLAMQSFINAQGSVFMAATSVGGRVLNLTNEAMNALSSAGTTFSGQNYGAKNYERLRWGALRIPAAYLIDRFFDGTWGMAGIPSLFCFGLPCMAGSYLLSLEWKRILQNPIPAGAETQCRSCYFGIPLFLLVKK